MIKKIYILIAVPLISVIAMAVVFKNGTTLLFSDPFDRKLIYENPSYTVTDKTGNCYTIDRSMRRIVKVDSDGSFQWSVEGGKREPGSFFYAYEMDVDDNGNLYVINGVLDNEGFFMLREEIVRFSSSGQFDGVIYTKNYGEDERRPELVQRGQFCGIRTELNGVRWFDISENGIQSIRVLEPHGAVERITAVPLDRANLLVSGVNGLYDGSVVYCTKKGEIIKSGRDGESTLLFSADERTDGLSIPWWVNSDMKGNVYFTDLARKSIMRINRSGKLEMVLNKNIIEKSGHTSTDYIYYRMSINGNDILSTFNDNYIVTVSLNKGDIQHYSDGGKLSAGSLIKRALCWVIIFLSSGGILFTGIFIYIRIINKRIPLMVKQVLIFTPMLAVSVALPARLIIEDFADRYKEELNKKISLMVQVAPGVTDADDFDKIRLHKDYMGEAYNRIRGSLLKAFNYSTDDWNRGLYFAVYRVYNDNIYGCMYFNGGIGVYYPFNYFDDPDSIYRAAYKGEIVTESLSDAWGSWIYGVGPIYGKDGKVKALIEVGTDLYSYNQAINRLIIKMVIRVCVITALFVILLMVVTYLLLISIRRLSSGVTRLSRGEWDTKVDVGKRNDEVSDLASGFNRMSEYILNYINQIVSLNRGYLRFVPEQFIKYLDRESVTEVQLGDQVHKVMTVMFSDIRSFTSLSEKMTPKDNFDFLNSYLRHVGPVIREHNGFIDKYIGDAVMALFPLSADDALEAAIGMFHNLHYFNESRKEEGLETIEIGIGLHTGPLMLGIIGEDERMEGTVISDNVNFASRLEGLTKHYGARVLISETTYNTLKHPERYLFRNLGKVKVKGKSKPVSVFEALDPLDRKEKEMKLKTRDVFEKGILLFQQRKFNEAVSKFDKILEVDSKDRAVLRYHSAASLMAKKPASEEEWDGTLEMREK